MLGLDEIGKIRRAHYRDGRSFREASLGSICPERGVPRVEIGHQRLVRPQILHRNQFVGPTFSIRDHVAPPDQIKWAARPLLRADLQPLHFAIDISLPAGGSSNPPKGDEIVERCPPVEPTL